MWRYAVSVTVWCLRRLTLMFPSVIPPTHSALSSLDVNECKEPDTCGANATCFNTNGSYYCTCNSGFALKSGASSFSGTGERCEGKGNTKEIRNKKLCSHFWIFGFASCLFVFHRFCNDSRLEGRWWTDKHMYPPPICFLRRHMFDQKDNLWKRNLPPHT